MPIYFPATTSNHNCIDQSNSLHKCSFRFFVYHFQIELGRNMVRDRQPIHAQTVSWLSVSCLKVELRTRWRLTLCAFRFSFHSVTEDGNPWLDMSHIVTTLNKLDAGTMEKVSSPQPWLGSRVTVFSFIVLGTTNEPRWAICFSLNLRWVKTMLVRSF